MESKYNFADNFREQILRCSSCGFCRAVCPVFGLTKRPAYNARGKMLILKEVMDGTIELTDKLIETVFQCTTCASCTQHCPSGVNPPEIIKQARQDMVRSGSCHPAFKGMNEVLESHTNIYAEEKSEKFERVRSKKAEYVFFIGCMGSYREIESTMSTLALLDRLEVDYTLIDEVCCSGLLEDVGFEISEQLAQKNIDQILATGAKTVIAGCPYCARTFNHKDPYGIFKDKGIKVVHVSQFLNAIDFGVQTNKRVTYHDPCNLGRHSGIFEAPREIIRKIAPDFVEMRHNRTAALCCGAGGGVKDAFAENALAMAQRRLKEVEETGAEVLLTECSTCVHNFSHAKLKTQKFEICTMTRFINQLFEKSAASNHKMVSGC